MPKSEPTVKLVVNITKELKENLVENAKRVFGNRRGAVSLYTEMILRKALQGGGENADS